MVTDRRVVLRSSADLGFALGEIRVDRERTQAHVAASVGMDRSQLAHLEAGRKGRFLDNLLALVGELDAQITIAWSVPEREVLPADGLGVVEVVDVVNANDEREHPELAASGRDAAAHRVGSRAPVEAQFRRQQQATDRVLEPIRRQLTVDNPMVRQLNAELGRVVDPMVRQLNAESGRVVDPMVRREEQPGDRIESE